MNLIRDVHGAVRKKSHRTVAILNFRSPQALPKIAHCTVNIPELDLWIEKPTYLN